MKTKKIKAQYFIEVYKSIHYNDVYNGNCYPISCLNEFIRLTEQDYFFKTIAIFKIKLKNDAN